MAETYAQGGNGSGPTRVAGDVDGGGNFVARGSLTGIGGGSNDGVDVGSAIAASTAAGARETGGNLAAAATVLGATSDAAVTTNTTGTISGKLRGIIALIAAKIGVTIADGDHATFGLKADAKSTATDTTAVSAMSVWKQISASVQAAASSLAGTLTIATHAVTQSGTWTVQPGNTANTTAWKVDGSGATQPVSAASLPLPSGAATATGQAAQVQAAAGSSGSTSITAGGTAQNLFGGATPTNGFEVCNPDASNDLWISDETTAAANGQGSIRVAANGGSYTTPPGYRPIGAVSIVGAVTGQKITARKW
jgi:hypothetical protein